MEELTLDFEDCTPKNVPQHSWARITLYVVIEQLADDISSIARLQ